MLQEIRGNPRGEEIADLWIKKIALSKEITELIEKSKEDKLKAELEELSNAQFKDQSKLFWKILTEKTGKNSVTPSSILDQQGGHNSNFSEARKNVKTIFERLGKKDHSGKYDEANHDRILDKLDTIKKICEIGKK